MKKRKTGWRKKALEVAFKKGREFHNLHLLPDWITEKEGDALQLAFCAGMMGWPCKIKRLVSLAEKPEVPPEGGRF